MPKAGGGYYVRQLFPSGAWQAVGLDWWQAERMRERGERIYQTAAQAWAVARRLNQARSEQEED